MKIDQGTKGLHQPTTTIEISRISIIAGTEQVTLLQTIATIPKDPKTETMDLERRRVPVLVVRIESITTATIQDLLLLPAVAETPEIEDERSL